jgi:hypothetical protein
MVIVYGMANMNQPEKRRMGRQQGRRELSFQHAKTDTERE